ncbi:DUF4785 family protein [Shewanella surugensis]|uniref:DUF4785 family protein n=1 Tax=Shewanella surugensis TaxID=212020 RepID=A0ABT0L6G2_9GAMM|nr:DUF4785 family protein [Shewanella surugensis]MCL1123277.1 DUF4785 family protein [Shewanella surugensis]
MSSMIKFASALLFMSSPLAVLHLAHANDNTAENTAISPVKIELLSSQSLVLSSPKVSDLHASEISSVSLSAINTRRQYVSYVSKMSSHDLYTPSMTQTSQSDQYWKTVTGAQLNKGLPFAVSQTHSVIRLAPRFDTLTSLNINDTISPDDIIVTPYTANPDFAIKGDPINENAISLIYSKVDADALATAGLSDHSSALALSSEAKPGLYWLKVNKSLPSDGRYLLNVKEKHSPFQLSLNAPIAVAENTDAIRFNLALTNSQAPFTPKAFLKNNQGQQTPLKVIKYADHWQALLPQGESLSTHNAGLSEIVVNVDTQIDGLPVIRSVKTAFKAFVNSAKISKKVSVMRQDKQLQSILLNIDVANEGRYEVSAVFTGTNKQGQSEVILKTQAANWITRDSPQLKLMLDAKLIQASGLKAPFALTQLELKDQSQMARLSYQAHALTFK